MFGLENGVGGVRPTAIRNMTLLDFTKVLRANESLTIYRPPALGCTLFKLKVDLGAVVLCKDVAVHPLRDEWIAFDLLEALNQLRMGMVAAAPPEITEVP